MKQHSGTKYLLSILFVVMLCFAACGKTEPEERTVEGDVLQYNEAVLSVESEYNTYSFSIENIDPEMLPSGMVPGSRILITYRGDPDDENCEILQITMVQTEPEIAPPESAPESESVAMPVAEHQLRAVIVDAAMHSLTVEAEDGQTYVFDLAMDNTQIYQDTPSNLAVGSSVEIGYNGTLGELDCELVSIQELSTPEGDAVLPLASVSGTVTQANETSITLDTADGELQFAIDDNTKIYIPGGVTADMQVTVEYRGETSDAMTAEAVYAG